MVKRNEMSLIILGSIFLIYFMLESMVNIYIDHQTSDMNLKIFEVDQQRTELDLQIKKKTMETNPSKQNLRRSE